jgi:isopenicillin N synthase-like dioxygenase
MSLTTIPIVDLSEFVKGDNESKQKFVEELGKAFEETGFVSVRNHGVPQELIDRYYALTETFFNYRPSKKRPMKFLNMPDNAATLLLEENMQKAVKHLI